MYIKKISEDYLINQSKTVFESIKKIDSNKSGFILVTDNKGHLIGVLTDGDIRRWLTSGENNDIQISVQEICNTDFIFSDKSSDLSEIENLFSEKSTFIPIIDSNKRIDSIAFRYNKSYKISTFEISIDKPTFIIAEIGNNHNGSLELAYELVDQAVFSGADCAKFQMRSKGLYNLKNSEDLGAEYTLDLLSKFQLENNDLFKVFDYCKEKGILPLCTPFDLESLLQLENYGMPAYKVASADLTNHMLLKEMCKTGKPLICSTGMATESEILTSVALLKKNGANFALLHCNSTYPAPFKDINLNYLSQLKKIGGNCPIGYSGHERGISVPVAAVSLGARIVEKHFTLDKSMEGNDHKVSLLPEEFKNMVNHIREVELAMGNSGLRTISQGEMMNREVLAKSLIANKCIKKGQVILSEYIETRSPGNGLQPNNLDKLVGKIAKRDIDKDDFFYESDIDENSYISKKYNFNRPFGIPVRFHDFESIIDKSNFDVVEFHLSYSDLNLRAEDYLSRKSYNLDLVIHSPELFSNDHLMDLCSEDNEYRNKSISNLEEVIKKTLELKPFFKSERPLIIINAGGWSIDKIHLSDEQKNKKYDLIGQAINYINTKGVEIIIQTMPPFPWHFGGQRFHNLFLDADEIVSFCKKFDKRICLDVSHSKLYCIDSKKSFSQFLEKTFKYSAHHHIVDAEGVDSEGLQIGDGIIDFKNLGEIMNKYSPNTSFIPEIWQGHKNAGEGFWEALEKLEAYFKSN
jgi:sialic acid synthase SpsE/endonuclease IV